MSLLFCTIDSRYSDSSYDHAEMPTKQMSIKGIELISCAASLCGRKEVNMLRVNCIFYFLIKFFILIFNFGEQITEIQKQKHENKHFKICSRGGLN